MIKYLKRVNSNGVESYNPEGTAMFIPGDPLNTDYSRMLEEVEAGTSTIEEVEN